MQGIRKSTVALLLGLVLLVSAAVRATEAKMVNLNTATTAELVALKGIGEVKAKAIVDYREKNGPFKTVDDLKLVRGVGDKLLEDLRPQLTTGAAPEGRQAKQ